MALAILRAPSVKKLSLYEYGKSLEIREEGKNKMAVSVKI